MYMTRKALLCRSEHIPFLLTPTLLRVLTNSLSKPDTHLHSAAKRLIEHLARHAESAPGATLRVAVAVALQRQRGGGFDKLTKTKYASNLLKVCPFHPSIACIKQAWIIAAPVH